MNQVKNTTFTAYLIVLYNLTFSNIWYALKLSMNAARVPQCLVAADAGFGEIRVEN